MQYELVGERMTAWQFIDNDLPGLLREVSEFIEHGPNIVVTDLNLSFHDHDYQVTLYGSTGLRP